MGALCSKTVVEADNLSAKSKEKPSKGPSVVSNVIHNDLNTTREDAESDYSDEEEEIACFRQNSFCSGLNGVSGDEVTTAPGTVSPSPQIDTLRRGSKSETFGRKGHSYVSSSSGVVPNPECRRCSGKKKSLEETIRSLGPPIPLPMLLNHYNRIHISDITVMGALLVRHASLLVSRPHNNGIMHVSSSLKGLVKDTIQLSERIIKESAEPSIGFTGVICSTYVDAESNSMTNASISMIAAARKIRYESSNSEGKKNKYTDLDLRIETPEQRESTRYLFNPDSPVIHLRELFDVINGAADLGRIPLQSLITSSLRNIDFDDSSPLPPRHTQSSAHTPEQKRTFVPPLTLTLKDRDILLASAIEQDEFDEALNIVLGGAEQSSHAFEFQNLHKSHPNNKDATLCFPTLIMHLKYHVNCVLTFFYYYIFANAIIPYVMHLRSSASNNLNTRTAKSFIIVHNGCLESLDVNHTSRSCAKRVNVRNLIAGVRRSVSDFFNPNSSLWQRIDQVEVVESREGGNSTLGADSPYSLSCGLSSNKHVLKWLIHSIKGSGSPQQFSLRNSKCEGMDTLKSIGIKGKSHIITKCAVHRANSLLRVEGIEKNFEVTPELVQLVYEKKVLNNVSQKDKRSSMEKSTISLSTTEDSDEYAAQVQNHTLPKRSNQKNKDCTIYHDCFASLLRIALKLFYCYSGGALHYVVGNRCGVLPHPLYVSDKPTKGNSISTAEAATESQFSCSSQPSFHASLSGEDVRDNSCGLFAKCEVFEEEALSALLRLPVLDDLFKLFLNDKLNLTAASVLLGGNSSIKVAAYEEANVISIERHKMSNSAHVRGWMSLLGCVINASGLVVSYGPKEHLEMVFNSHYIRTQIIRKLPVDVSKEDAYQQALMRQLSLAAVSASHCQSWLPFLPFFLLGTESRRLLCYVSGTIGSVNVVSVAAGAEPPSKVRPSTTQSLKTEPIKAKGITLHVTVTPTLSHTENNGCQKIFIMGPLWRLNILFSAASCLSINYAQLICEKLTSKVILHKIKQNKQTQLLHLLNEINAFNSLTFRKYNDDFSLDSPTLNVSEIRRRVSHLRTLEQSKNSSIKLAAGSESFHVLPMFFPDEFKPKNERELNVTEKKDPIVDFFEGSAKMIFSEREDVKASESRNLKQILFDDGIESNTHICSNKKALSVALFVVNYNLNKPLHTKADSAEFVWSADQHSQGLPSALSSCESNSKNSKLKTKEDLAVDVKALEFLATTTHYISDNQDDLIKHFFPQNELSGSVIAFFIDTNEAVSLLYSIAHLKAGDSLCIEADSVSPQSESFKLILKVVDVLFLLVEEEYGLIIIRVNSRIPGTYLGGEKMIPLTPVLTTATVAASAAGLDFLKTLAGTRIVIEHIVIPPFIRYNADACFCWLNSQLVLNYGKDIYQKHYYDVVGDAVERLYLSNVDCEIEKLFNASSSPRCPFVHPTEQLFFTIGWLLAQALGNGCEMPSPLPPLLYYLFLTKDGTRILGLKDPQSFTTIMTSASCNILSPPVREVTSAPPTAGREAKSDILKANLVKNGFFCPVEPCFNTRLTEISLRLRDVIIDLMLNINIPDEHSGNLKLTNNPYLLLPGFHPIVNTLGPEYTAIFAALRFSLNCNQEIVLENSNKDVSDKCQDSVKRLNACLSTLESVVTGSSDCEKTQLSNTSFKNISETHVSAHAFSYATETLYQYLPLLEAVPSEYRRPCDIIATVPDLGLEETLVFLHSMLPSGIFGVAKQFGSNIPASETKPESKSPKSPTFESMSSAIFDLVVDFSVTGVSLCDSDFSESEFESAREEEGSKVPCPPSPEAIFLTRSRKKIKRNILLSQYINYYLIPQAIFGPALKVPATTSIPEIHSFFGAYSPNETATRQNTPVSGYRTVYPGQRLLAIASLGFSVGVCANGLALRTANCRDVARILNAASPRGNVLPFIGLNGKNDLGLGGEGSTNTFKESAGEYSFKKK